MCSICGGTAWDNIAEFIWKRSSDRGRDDHGMTKSGGAWIGNHRATPTTETQHPIERQPVGTDIKIVFNGIISNDHEFTKLDGEADTSILPRILNFTDLFKFKESIQQIKGSYAIAAMHKDGTIWLAANYKPIWIAKYLNKYYFSSLQSHFPSFVSPYRFHPYSVGELTTKIVIPIERPQSKKALVICSSGLDSTTVAAFACVKHHSENVTLIHYKYGCRAENKEVEQVKKIADYLKCSLQILPMPSFGGSTLLEENSEISQGIAGAEYAHEWVPARNLLMLSMTTAYAEAKGYGHIYLGTNLEESGAYPDNEEQFILDFNNLLYGAVQNGVKIEIHSPLGGLMKHEIIPFGNICNTPYHLTWSCYKNGDKHCGVCGPCFMRRTAFERNGLKDPVEYENN